MRLFQIVLEQPLLFYSEDKICPMNDSMKNKCKDNFAVLSGRNNSFDWKKLLFHAGGTFVSIEETFVSCWWNFYFDWKKLLFSAGGTFVYSA